jgi:hypothetical protein
MTTLTTKKQYALSWSGTFPKWNYSSNHLGGLFLSEKDINDYLDEKVSQGWIIVEASIKEIN